MSAPATDPAVPPPRRAILLCAAVLALAALAAYANTFSVPFLFDDSASILDNPSILHLWPLSTVLSPTGGYGITVSGRPVLNLSLALCYAISGTHPWSYHAFNLLIHILAGLTLFGIVRRTLARMRSKEQGARSKAVPDSASPVLVSTSSAFPPAPCSLLLQQDAVPVAFAIALLWTLHPLQTEAVTYIIQRTESMMGLFFLLTLYGFIRATGGTHEVEGAGGREQETATAEPARQSPAPLPLAPCPLPLPPAALWSGLSILCCLLGMGTKEVTAVAPVLVFLYDRTFVAGSFRAAWQRRRWLHLGLAATWLPLLYWLSTTGWNRGGTAGFDVGVSPWTYWFTQFEAVARYLKQSVWPHPLVFEYGTFWAGPADAAPYALVVVPLAVAALVALWRRPVLGFLGAWFFAILAPTSLVPGSIQMIVEHRMYLPLAAVLAAVVGAAAARLGRPALVAAVVLAAGLEVLTRQRNATYRSDLSLWSDTVAHRPASAIAQSGLGTALYLRGRTREAMLHYRVSLGLNPNLASIHYNMGLAYADLGRLSEAAAQYAESFRINPRFYPSHYQLGLTLLLMNRPQDALTHFDRVVQLMPTFPEAQYEWGIALARLGRPADAIPHYREALRLDPDYVDAECGLGAALYQLNRAPEAVACFQRALRVRPDLADARFNLGLALARIGSTEQAAAQYAEAVRLDPAHAAAQLNLGIALAQTGRVAEALGHLQTAVQLEPALAEAHCNLGIVLAQAGRPADAVAQFREALRLRPDYAAAHYNLGNTLITLRQLPEARRHFEEALRVDPHFDAAREMLDRFRALPDVP